MHGRTFVIIRTHSADHWQIMFVMMMSLKTVSPRASNDVCCTHGEWHTIINIHMSCLQITIGLSASVTFVNYWDRKKLATCLQIAVVVDDRYQCWSVVHVAVSCNKLC